jgi:23S rRNA (pseudouridine1915-N3)-methyltransferase
VKIKLLQIGQTKTREIQQLVEVYQNRLKHFIQFEIISLPDIKYTKSLSELQQKEMEADVILKHIQPSDWLVLLDEKGKSYTSEKFADFLQQKMNSGIKTLVFVIGGPYGFSDKVYGAAKQKVALSSMTFTHEMIRLLFAEQVYRAYAILNNLPYHHH